MVQSKKVTVFGMRSSFVWFMGRWCVIIFVYQCET